MSDEIKATVYQTDGWFMALCTDFPGITGYGRTREECIQDLTRRIEESLRENSRLVRIVQPSGS